MNIYSRFIHYSPKWEVTQILWIECNHTLIYLHLNRLYKYSVTKNELLSHATVWMNLFINVDWKQTQKITYLTGSFVENKNGNRRVLWGDWERGMRKISGIMKNYMSWLGCSHRYTHVPRCTHSIGIHIVKLNKCYTLKVAHLPYANFVLIQKSIKGKLS